MEEPALRPPTLLTRRRLPCWHSTRFRKFPPAIRMSASTITWVPKLRPRTLASAAWIGTFPTKIRCSCALKVISEPEPLMPGFGLWPTYDVTHNQFFTVGERHIFSPNLISQFTSSFSRPVTGETQPTPHSALQLFTPARSDVFVALPEGLGALGSSFIAPFQYLQNKFTEIGEHGLDPWQPRYQVRPVVQAGTGLIPTRTRIGTASICS